MIGPENRGVPRFPRGHFPKFGLVRKSPGRSQSPNFSRKKVTTGLRNESILSSERCLRLRRIRCNSPVDLALATGDSIERNSCVEQDDVEGGGR
jgi:hypothetical protein